MMVTSAAATKAWMEMRMTYTAAATADARDRVRQRGSQPSVRTTCSPQAYGDAGNRGNSSWLRYYCVARMDVISHPAKPSAARQDSSGGIDMPRTKGQP